MKKIKLLILITLVISVTSCSLFKKLSAPHYNAVTYQLAVTADSTMNALYSGFANGSDLSYANNSSVYTDVEYYINQKIGIDSTRKYPTQILALDRTYLEVVETSRQDHQSDGNISNNHVNVNGALLKQMGNILVNTEKTYK